MALFKPYKITSDKLSDLPVQEGQIVITTDTKKLYVDVSATKRIGVTSDADVDTSDFVTKEDADATYAAIEHNHDDRYYTESEVDSKLADKANTTHTHANATTSAAGFLPKLGGGTTNFLRADGTWAKPPDTNTTYTLSSFGITATAAELNKLDGVTTTATQLNYLNTLTGDVQTQLNGKAASSHNHYNLSFRGKVGATTNWDSLSDGIWSVGQSTFSATYNQPVGAYSYGTLRVYNNGSNIAQIYIACNNGQMWFRDRFSSSNDFTSWARTYTTLSKPTASEIGAAASSHSHSNYLTTSGTAAAATKLATARTFSLTGDVTGSASFNGTANCSIATTLAANSVTANEIASGAVGLSELSSTVGTIAVQSATPTDSHVKLWIKL